MKQTSGLIPSLGRSLEGGTPENGDTELSIPAVHLPVLDACYPMQAGQNLAAGSTFNIEYRESFAVDWLIDRAAAGGSQTTRLGYLMAGYWEWTTHWHIGTPAAGNSVSLQYNFMTWPDLNGLQLVNVFQSFGSGAIQVLHGNHSFKFLIPKGHAYRITAIVDNTAGTTSWLVRFFTQFRRLA